MADEEVERRIKKLEEQKYELQKQIASQKMPDGNWTGHPPPLHQMRPFVGSMEEEALLNEMEVTGQAFEDMQVSLFLFKKRCILVHILKK